MGRASDADRATMDRQARALAELELDRDDDGDDDWRRALVTWADSERRRLGIEPLKTETELHRRARALGLLRRLS